MGPVAIFDVEPGEERRAARAEADEHRAIGGDKAPQSDQKALYRIKTCVYFQ
jgi:hypothetical protein